MNETLSLPVRENAKQTDARVSVAAESLSFGGSRPPVIVPRGQLYYWTRHWQQGESESLRDVLEGRVRRFTSGADAARWLLAADSDDADAGA